MKTQPASMFCSVTNGGPTAMGAGDVSNVTVTCVPSDVSYYFPFDGDAKDYGPNHHDFTVVNATPTTDRHGNANSAYAFNGTNAYMVADGTSLVTGSGARSMSMWLKPADSNNLTGILYQGNNDCTGKMFGIGRSSGKNFFWGGCLDQGASGDVPVDTWTFVGVTFTPPNVLKIYTGTNEETFTLPSTPNTTASSLWLGSETVYDSANFRNRFKGSVDDVRVYNRALTTAEMNALAALP